MEIRCPSRIVGIVGEDALLEVKCPSKGCKTDDGQVVFHYFDLSSGRMVDTKRYRDATAMNIHKTQEKENRNGAHHDASAVRTS